MERIPRPESEVFKDLECLCSQTGYIHVIAYFCIRDNVVGFDKILSGESLATLYRPERLIRTEISILIGLLCKAEIRLDFPTPEEFVKQIIKTEELLREFHDALNYQVLSSLKSDMTRQEIVPARNSSFLRESIFYANESAFPFQYLSFSKERYLQDEEWLQANKGFTINDAEKIINSIFDKLNTNVNQFGAAVRKDPRCAPTAMLFQFTLEEITRESGVKEDIVHRFITAFEFVPNNKHNLAFSGFSTLNETNIRPFLKVADGTWILFQVYSILESIYESPHFWMSEDKAYWEAAKHNRGKYLESFAQKLMSGIFGAERVFSNLDVYKGRNKVGEIDVLVIYANRAIIIQCKSKKLTIKSRMGSAEDINSDFSKAVQNSYDQCMVCSEAIVGNGLTMKYADGEIFSLDREVAEVIPICLLSEHYPSLSLQSANLLKLQNKEKVDKPFVMDIFTLDTISEFLDSPLLFLSYIIRRSQYWGKINSGHELTNLAYHLKQNLHFVDYDFMQIGDDIASELDAAMAVRRLGLPGNPTPEGLLTKFRNTFLWKLITEISCAEAVGALDAGLELLSFSGDSIRRISLGINAAISNAKKNGHSDITVPFDANRTGFTIHVNEIENDAARIKLHNHASYRMKLSCAKSWIGICINPNTEQIRFGVKIEDQNPMPLSSRDEQLLHADMKSPIRFALESGIISQPKRNDPCYCGSGRKFKKCCMNIP